MTTLALMEAFLAFLTATVALWFVVISPRMEPASPAPAPAPAREPARLPALLHMLRPYLLRHGLVASLGLLALRMAVGVMMIAKN